MPKSIWSWKKDVLVDIRKHALWLKADARLRVPAKNRFGTIRGRHGSSARRVGCE